MDLLRHIFAPALLLAALLCAPACEGQKDDASEGTGTLIVNISNPVELETRHASGEGSDASDGGIMKTLRVWLISTGGVILQYKDTVPNATTATVKFKDIDRGNYHICAVANYKGLNSKKDLINDYDKGKSIDSDFTAAIAGTITDGNSPSFDNDKGMPSSFLFMNKDISAGENIIDASLRRCVGRLTFNVRNNLDNYELIVHSIGLSKHNQTQGLLFEMDDEQYPSTSTEVNFPELESLVQVGPREVKKVYDIYLYKTATDISLTFDMLAALYPMGTTASSDMIGTETYTVDSYDIKTAVSDYTTGLKYLIRSSSSSTYYLGVDSSGNLVATSFTDESEITGNSNIDINDYLWEFSSGPSKSSGSGKGSRTTSYIYNAENKKYITLSSSSASLSATANQYSNRYSDKGLTFYYQNGLGWNQKNYYLALDSSNSPDVDENAYYWKVQEAKKVSAGATRPVFQGYTAQIPRTTRPIKYIDNYGASQLLTKIDRNEHVTVNVNVFYNRELGEFQFEVLDWDDGGEHQTTFD